MMKITAEEIKKTRKMANTLLTEESDDRLEVEALSQRLTKALKRSKKYKAMHNLPH